MQPDLYLISKKIFNFTSKKMNLNYMYSLAIPDDISEVLRLQSQYLVSNLDAEQKKGGFVTTPFTVEQLTDVIDQEGLFLAKKNEVLVAYCFAASWQYFSAWPIFEYMVRLFPEWSFQKQEITVDNSFQYGPICIDVPFRGQGIINGLVEFMRQNMVVRYPIAVTFINKINAPSFKAHTQKLNWHVISEFEFNNNKYYVLAIDMTVKIE
jgi:hypothetical protein